MSIDDLGIYQEQLLEHYKNPRYRGRLEKYNFSSGKYNPSCGDEIEITGHIHDNKVDKVLFEGQGCIISQAVASMLLEKAIDQPLEEVISWSKDTIKQWLNIDLGPTRLKCALLSLEALQQGINQYRKEKAEGR